VGAVRATPFTKHTAHALDAQPQKHTRLDIARVSLCRLPQVWRPSGASAVNWRLKVHDGGALSRVLAFLLMLPVEPFMERELVSTLLRIPVACFHARAGGAGAGGAGGAGAAGEALPVQGGVGGAGQRWEVGIVWCCSVQQDRANCWVSFRSTAECVVYYLLHSGTDCWWLCAPVACLDRKG
jgi:hypothetical protein